MKWMMPCRGRWAIIEKSIYNFSSMCEVNSKILPILLIFSILTGQVVIRCAHTHASCGDSGDSLAHVHIGTDCHDHHHGHGHHGHGHGHHHGSSDANDRCGTKGDGEQCHDDQGSKPDRQHSPEPNAVVNEFDIQPHDCNAVYINEDSHTVTLSQIDLTNFVAVMCFFPDIVKGPCSQSLHWQFHSSQALPGLPPVFLQTKRILL